MTIQIAIVSLLLSSGLWSFAAGFTTSQVSRTRISSSPNSVGRSETTLQLSASEGADASDGDEEDSASLRREQSRMNDFISEYLGKDGSESGSSENWEDLETATHLIAIPMETNHELLLELESVQRAILYHCPILTDACIPAATTRLPLLYVRASSSKMGEATRRLSETIHRLVQKHIFQPVSIDGEEISEDMVNADGFLPLTMTFQTLEIEGANNNVLQTVGTDSSKRLDKLMKELKSAVEKEGWQAALPEDPNDTRGIFRPRIPFMELPREFDENLSKLKDGSTEIREEDFPFLNSSEGGNGISPIFWCRWWDDVFGRNVRLKQIGVYPRNVQQPMSSDLSYVRFYMPFDTIDLPAATSGLLRNEQKFETYQNERIKEQEEEMKSAIDTSASGADDDLLLKKTQKRLEKIYEAPTAPESGYVDSEAVEEVANQKTEAQETSLSNYDDAGIDDDDFVVTSGLQQMVSPDDFVEDWTKERIRKVIESQGSEKARKPVKKDMPPIAENAVFKAYKDGTLTPKAEKAKPKEKDLGPYPGPAHFTGLWKVVNSPTGFPADEISTGESSENLILRVDGTTAGGPILDPETRQKAAGGTWKILEGKDGEVQLRVRLLIPPMKQRVIEMIGVVNRVSMSSDVPTTSKAFGIPHLEEMAKLSSGSNLDDFMMCTGKVFIEDAVTKKNRESIGEFALTKMQGPKSRGDYTITIPKAM